MNHSLSLSVVIPTTGRNLDQLKECLTSVFEARQTERLQEIIIAGNGLPAESAARVRELMTTIHVPESLTSKLRLHCFPDKEESIAKSWNRAFELAHADYVHFLHDDDRVGPSFYARNIEVIERDGPDLLFCGAEQFGAKSGIVLWRGRKRGQNGFLNNAERKEHVTQRYEIPCPTAIYRTSAWKELHGWDGLYGFACDQAYFFDALMSGQRIYAVQEPLYLYRLHEESATSQVTRGCNLLMEILMLQAYARLYRESPEESLLTEAADHIAIYYYDGQLKARQRGLQKTGIKMLRSMVKRSRQLRRVLLVFNPRLRSFLDWYLRAIETSDPALLRLDCRELPHVPFQRFVDEWGRER